MPQAKAKPPVVPFDVIEHLAAIDRTPGSPGEAEAAAWFAERLAGAGCEVTIDEAQFYDGYARPLAKMTTAATLGGLLAQTKHGRRLGGVLAGLAAVGIADDASNGPRFFRKLTGSPIPTQNVVGIAGDKNAERTLVLLGHHDAAPTGKIFDDTLQSALGERFPGVLERIDTSIPLWWLVLSGPVAAAVGAKRRNRKLAAFGAVASGIATAAFVDVARSPTVPGANDNLTALAVEVGLAERLLAKPIPGLRVMLVSCGAEEVVQGGIYSFAERHFPQLDRDKTWVLTLETLGSPNLILLEGEGTVVMEDYTHRPFRDLIARCADRSGAQLRRGMRARNSTDAVIPSRAGYPTATLASMDRYKALSNYHMMSDTPENIVQKTVSEALLVVEEVAKELASNPWL
jgi:peptidase M28-like protein